MIAKNWTAVAQLVDPAELARNKAMFKPVFDRDTTKFLMLRILNDTTRRSIDMLSDLEFNAKLFAFAIGLRSQNTAFDRFTGVQIFGVARPEPDHAFVVYQFTLPSGERPIRGRQVVELHRRNGRWMLDMLSDFTDLKELVENR
jgi:hypothetical protein